MNLFFKTISALFLSLTIMACSSTPEQTVVKIGKVKRVKLEHIESKPSVVAVLSAATVSGLVGYQFGGGSAKYWSAGSSAIVGGVITNKALEKNYNLISYKIYITEEKKYFTLKSQDLNNNIFRNDIVVIHKKGNDIQIDAYGKYSDYKYKVLKNKIAKNSL